MGQCQKRLDERIAMACAHQIMNDGQISQKEMMGQKKGNLLGIKGLNRVEKLK